MRRKVKNILICLPVLYCSLFLSNVSFAQESITEEVKTSIDNQYRIDITNIIGDKKTANRDIGALIFYTYYKYLGINLPTVNSEAKCTFSDVGKAKEQIAINAACRLGIVSGTSTKKFYPNNPLTNAEAITMLMRITYGKQNEISALHRSEPYYRLANSLGLLKQSALYSKFSPITTTNLKTLLSNTANILTKNPNITNDTTGNVSSSKINCSNNKEALILLAKKTYTGSELTEALAKIDEKCK